MIDYTTKSYGRNEEVVRIFSMFKAGRDITQHGQRRLGKTFVLERMVDQSEKFNFKCVKLEVAGCTEPKTVFRKLCEAIDNHRNFLQKAVSIPLQRITQAVSPKSDQLSQWHQTLTGMDWESYLNRLLEILNKDNDHQWAILIDELPIFLKAMHDKGDAGIQEARNFMNHFSELRSKYPRVRWLITGSIGIDPLASAGNYSGAVAKFQPFLLLPLTEEQAIDFLIDSAKLGKFHGRTVITEQEAKAIIEAVGWRTAYYLDHLAQNLPPNPEIEAVRVQQNIDAALNALLAPHNRSSFSTWEEHIKKHHTDAEKKLSYAILNALASEKVGLNLDSLIATLTVTGLTKQSLHQHLSKLIDESFLYQEPDGELTAPYRFRIALLRLWWLKYIARTNMR